MANVSENWSDLGDKTSGGESPQLSRTVYPDQSSQQEQRSGHTEQDKLQSSRRGE